MPFRSVEDIDWLTGRPPYRLWRYALSRVLSGLCVFSSMCSCKTPAALDLDTAPQGGGRIQGRGPSCKPIEEALNSRLFWGR